MDGLPPLMRDQRKVDVDHLNLLAIFHFIYAVLGLVGLGFLALHRTMMHMFIDNPEIWKNQPHGAPPPKEFFAIFDWFYLIFGVLLVATLVVNVVSGLCLRAKRFRALSIAIAGLDCIQIPFGTCLGVFTILVLMRDSVRDLYEYQLASTSPRTA